MLFSLLCAACPGLQTEIIIFLQKALLDISQVSPASSTNFQCSCPHLPIAPFSVPVTGWLHPSRCQAKNLGFILDYTLIPTPRPFHQQILLNLYTNSIGYSIIASLLYYYNFSQRDNLFVPSYLLASFTGCPSPPQCPLSNNNQKTCKESISIHPLHQCIPQNVSSNMWQYRWIIYIILIERSQKQTCPS